MSNRVNAGTIALLACFVACLPADPSFAQWYAVADFMVPMRIGSSDTVFQRDESEVLDDDGIGTGEYVVGSLPLLSASDFDLVFTAAGRIIVGNHGETMGIEGCYMRTNQWDSHVSAYDPSGRMASPFSQVGSDVSPLFDDNLFASATYATEWESAELHITRVLMQTEQGETSLLFGVRLMSINEALEYQQASAATSYQLLIDVDNRLIGPQLGLTSKSSLWGGILDLTAKCAVTYNAIDKQTDFNGVTGSGNDGAAALLGECDVAYMFLPTPNLAIRIGYQIVGLSDVALAPDNFEPNPTVLESGLAPIARGGAAYHAPYIGAALAY